MKMSVSHERLRGATLALDWIGDDVGDRGLNPGRMYRGRVGNHLRKTIIRTPDRDSNPCHPIIVSLVYCLSNSLDHVVTEAGEGCVEKPLSTLWKNYTSSSKPDVQMKVTVSQGGLRAVTKEHGLTEYWAHRITYCSAPSSFPRVFCWVYRHEGRKLKQELRCHAVICSKESVARNMASQLRAKLIQALTEFKRDKVCRQNARLSLANAVYDNPSLPRRKILLSMGSHNYRPPLERSKSAPKLMVIEESVEEDDEDVRTTAYHVAGTRLAGVHTTTERGIHEQSRRPNDAKDTTTTAASVEVATDPSDLVQDIMALFHDHQQSMRAERELALSGNGPEAVRRRRHPDKKVAWEDLVILSTSRLKEEEEELLESQSDEGTNSLQSISSGESSETAFTFVSSSSASEEPDNEGSCSSASSVDLRPTGGSLRGRKVVLETGMAVQLKRSATFPPPHLVVAETSELDSLSEEDEEDAVSDESGYAESPDVKDATFNLEDETLDAMTALSLKDKSHHRLILHTGGMTDTYCVHV
uniref:PID domain-containing protein n=1 Tax=Timema monikensis TaxID=170555 RepID=A0A7R9E4E8_9NEOP|nr:unnamed protein product [Timema monikensis]